MKRILLAVLILFSLTANGQIQTNAFRIRLANSNDSLAAILVDSVNNAGFKMSNYDKTVLLEYAKELSEVAAYLRAKAAIELTDGIYVDNGKQSLREMHQLYVKGLKQIRTDAIRRLHFRKVHEINLALKKEKTWNP